MKLCIRTQSGALYHVNVQGHIIRLDGRNGKGSDSWVMRGLKHCHKNQGYTLEELLRAYGVVSAVLPIGHVVPERPRLLYKNGKPQWRIADNDHGTHRVMGDGPVAIWQVD